MQFCLFLSCVLFGEWVDGVVGLCWALQGHSPQAEQDYPAGAAQCGQTLSTSGGACRLCRVLVSARTLSQFTWWEKSTLILPYPPLLSYMVIIQSSDTLWNQKDFVDMLTVPNSCLVKHGCSKVWLDQAASKVDRKDKVGFLRSHQCQKSASWLLIDL